MMISIVIQDDVDAVKMYMYYKYWGQAVENYLVY